MKRKDYPLGAQWSKGEGRRVELEERSREEAVERGAGGNFSGKENLLSSR